jgi:hypothetical protein
MIAMVLVLGTVFEKQISFSDVKQVPQLVVHSFGHSHLATEQLGAIPCCWVEPH